MIAIRFAPHSDAEGDPCQDPAVTGARAIAAAEALRAAESDDGQKAPLRPLTLKSVPGPPMTLGNAAAAHVRLIVWCWDCSHQLEPDPAEMAAGYGAETTVIDWRGRIEFRCGGASMR
jgi:hypothetical protein